jgi:hypothetical protein
MKNKEWEDMPGEWIELGGRRLPNFDAIAKATGIPVEKLQAMYFVDGEDEDEDGESEVEEPAIES